MSRNVYIGIAIAVLVILVGWYYVGSQRNSFSPPQPTPLSQETQPSEKPATDSADASSAEKNAVAISSTGFSPKDIVISVGETVTWMNSDTIDHTVDSANHPTHLIYPPLNLGVMKPGEKKSLAFPEAGIYKYHDHLNPSLFGSVTVQ